MSERPCESRGGAKSENLGRQVAMGIAIWQGGTLYFAKIWVGVGPSCPPAFYIPDVRVTMSEETCQGDCVRETISERPCQRDH